MKKFEKPTIEFVPLGVDIITTSTATIKDGGENNEPEWENPFSELFN